MYEGVLGGRQGRTNTTLVNKLRKALEQSTNFLNDNNTTLGNNEEAAAKQVDTNAAILTECDAVFGKEQ